MGGEMPLLTHWYTPPCQLEASSAATNETGRRKTSAGTT